MVRLWWTSQAGLPFPIHGQPYNKGVKGYLPASTVTCWYLERTTLDLGGGRSVPFISSKCHQLVGARSPCLLLVQVPGANCEMSFHLRSYVHHMSDDNEIGEIAIWSIPTISMLSTSESVQSYVRMSSSGCLEFETHNVKEIHVNRQTLSLNALTRKIT